MILNLFKGYPDRVGKRFIFAGAGVGPSSYSQTTGDVVRLNQFNNYIDVIHGGTTVSGTYVVRAIPSVNSLRATWRLQWVVVATGAEVANGIDLSAEKVVLGGSGGMY